MIENINFVNYTTSEWIDLILTSYRKIFDKDLISIDSNQSLEEVLFKANFYLVSHQYQNEPILVYANQKVLERWEMTWEQFIGTPSKYTAETDLQSNRAKMLAIAEKQGYFDNYEGVRISAKGNRFWIKKALIFNIYEHENEVLTDKIIGQAALFFNTENI